jgi:hypothetical protein
MTRRPLPDRLRYLAGQLRSGTDPAAVALALDATAEEMGDAEAADVPVEVHDLEWARRTSRASAPGESDARG